MLRAATWGSLEENICNALAWPPVQIDYSQPTRFKVSNCKEIIMQTKQIEKENLIRVCCERFRGAKAEAADIAAKRRWEFISLLETAFNIDQDDSPRGKLHRFANSAVARANEEIAHLAKESGTDLVFGPTLTISYGQWSEFVQHCTKRDWQMASCKIRRLETEAAAQIERTSMDTLIQLMDANLTPAEAAALVEAIPTAAALIPVVQFEDLKLEPDGTEDVKDAGRLAQERW
jgi:hypothetical protein